MPGAILPNARKRILARVIDVVWAQWASIAPPASAPRVAQSIVDPEALVLMSLVLADSERRLARLLAWAAKRVSKLLSVQRIKNLSKDFPRGIEAGLGGFAESALTEGGDRRWRSLVLEDHAKLPRARAVDAGAQPFFFQRSALMLRCRLAFGVGIKSDVMTYLVGSVGATRTIRQITLSTGYYGRAVRRAVDDLAASGLVRAVSSSPASYSVDFDAWAALMGLGQDGVPWRDWAAALALFAHVLDWARDPENAKRSPYLLSTDARDYMDAHGDAFSLNHVSPTAPQSAPGEAYLEVFLGDVERLADHLESLV